MTSATSFSSQASEAIAVLKELTARLPIDDTLPAGHGVTRLAARVPLEVMTIASGVLNDDPGLYPQFDAVAAMEAAEYEQAMVEVVELAETLAGRLRKSIAKRKAAMANQALALYGVMKATSRLDVSEQTRIQVKAMAKLLTTNRRSRAVAVTVEEKNAATRAMRVKKKVKAAEDEANEAKGHAAIASARAALEDAVASGAPLPSFGQAVALDGTGARGSSV